MTYIKIKDIHGCPHLINLNHIVSFSKDLESYVKVCLIDQRVIKVPIGVEEFEKLLMRDGTLIYGRNEGSWNVEFKEVEL
jgi:hypothetical protein